MTKNQQNFIKIALTIYPEIAKTKTITRKQALEICSLKSITYPQWLNRYQIERGLYKLDYDDSIIESIDNTKSNDLTDVFACYDAMANLIDGIATNKISSLIISGPAGIGKSYNVVSGLDKNNCNYVIHKGNLKPTHLYRLLYENNKRGEIIVIDDSDSIFSDELALNILKTALELKQTRVISWGSEYKILDSQAIEIPRYFEYSGSIIFITNKSLKVNSDSKLSCHLQALESRSLSININIDNNNQLVLLIEHIIKHNNIIDNNIVDDIINFMADNCNNFKELSIRTAEKMGMLYKVNSENWLAIAEKTLLN